MKSITLPTSRVNALSRETGKQPEEAVADILSVLLGRRMWAHSQPARLGSPDVVLFVYGQNVGTFAKEQNS